MGRYSWEKGDGWLSETLIAEALKLYSDFLEGNGKRPYVPVTRKEMVWYVKEKGIKVDPYTVDGLADFDRNEIFIVEEGKNEYQIARILAHEVAHFARKDVKDEDIIDAITMDALWRISGGYGEREGHPDERVRRVAEKAYEVMVLGGLQRELFDEKVYEGARFQRNQNQRDCIITDTVWKIAGNILWPLREFLENYSGKVVTEYTDKISEMMREIVGHGESSIRRINRRQ